MNPINVLLLVGFPVYFVSLWCLVLWIIAKFSGWHKLAKVYHYPEKFTGELHCFQSAKVNWAGFNNALNIGVSEQGLYLVPLLIFRAFFKPLLIPWSEIHSAPFQRLIFHGTRLTFASMPGVKIDFAQRTFEKITRSLERRMNAKESTEI